MTRHLRNALHLTLAGRLWRLDGDANGARQILFACWCGMTQRPVCLPDPAQDAMAAGYMPGCEIEIPATPDYYTADQMIAYAAASAAAEREACAQICDAHTVDDTLVGVGISRSCADMIRRRSIIADYPGRDK